jgi:hypothetical protein
MRVKFFAHIEVKKAIECHHDITRILAQQVRFSDSKDGIFQMQFRHGSADARHKPMCISCEIKIKTDDRHESYARLSSGEPLNVSVQSLAEESLPIRHDVYHCDLQHRYGIRCEWYSRHHTWHQRRHLLGI